MDRLGGDRLGRCFLYLATLAVPGEDVESCSEQLIGTSGVKNPSFGRGFLLTTKAPTMSTVGLAKKKHQQGGKNGQSGK